MNLICMPTRRHYRFFLPALILALGFAAFMLSCSSDSTTTPAEPRAWYYEYEFEQDPGLVARHDQVVILDIMPGEESTEHAIPYQNDEGGGYLFAIESDDPFITRVEVFDRFGVLVATTERGDGGVCLEMTPGSYSIKVYHDGADVPEEGSVAFIRRQVTEDTPCGEKPDSADMDEASSVIDPVHPAYVALQFMSGKHKGAYLTASRELFSVSGATLLKAGSLSETGGDNLFTFIETHDYPNCSSPPLFKGYYYFHSWAYDGSQNELYPSAIWCNWHEGICPPSQDKTTPQTGEVAMPSYTVPPGGELQMFIQDIDNGTFIPWTQRMFVCSPMYADTNTFVYFTEGSTYAQPDRFQIVDDFRFYKDGSQITKKDRQDLKKGEVALYEGENYTGVAVVLSAPFFPSSSFINVLAQIKSVAFGTYTHTTIQFFKEPNFSDLIRTVGVDTPQNLSLNTADIKSIKIFFDAKKILISTKKCPYCNLAGVKLSDLNLDAADLSYANLMGANMYHSSLKNSNISYALLYGANLNNANLSGASLYKAFLNGYKDLNLGAATLTGAYLKNANLAGANLAGADFSSASFYSGTYIQTGCAQDDQNSPFTKNCASAHGANMNATKFDYAYLAGTDFSKVTAQGTSFWRAILSGANFKNATLDWDSSTGVRTKFTGAFIGGADFTNSTVSGAKFDNAYVNFSSNGDCMLFTVSSAHTKFPGFYYKYGDTPCVMFAYSHPTVVVDTDRNNICPDGNSGRCDQTSWTSPSIPRDQSTQPNSSCFDPSPLCDIDHIDPNW